jgi:curli biogenesis system outer membrane secretion channel CsgG
VLQSSERWEPMRQFVLLLAVVALAGCGVDTATTAATSAAIKKEEVEQGRKTIGQAQQKVEQAAQQMQERAQRDSDTAGKQ